MGGFMVGVGLLIPFFGGPVDGPINGLGLLIGGVLICGGALLIWAPYNP